jgi:membrane-bound lytic murein transglycosylase B
MKILQTGDIDRGHLTGSWAGAMGHTQFIPTSYQAYAVDMDGNGKRDIWNSVPDALGTAANLLHRNGWQPGRTWGYEVQLPAGRKFPSGSLSAAEWQKLGVVRANGRPFPDANEKVTLKVLDGRQGPAFLMGKNFFVIKRYNNADKYALAVGLLADRIGGYQGLRQDWNRPFTPITMNEREELQTHLKALGYYDGKIDGKIGSTSRKAIEAFQQRNGLQPDGHPSAEVLSVLRRR